MGRTIRWTALILAAAVAACAQSEPSRFYLISSLPAADAPRPAGQALRAVSLLVGPVEIAKHLDRPEIVTFASANQIQLAEFDRWAEPLGDNLTRVLAENLAVLVPTDRIATFPEKRRQTYDLQVALAVSTLEVRSDNRMTMVVQWTLLGDDGRDVLVDRRSTFSEQAAPGYEAMAGTISATVAKLSREIAEAVRTASAPQPAGRPRR